MIEMLCNSSLFGTINLILSCVLFLSRHECRQYSQRVLAVSTPGVVGVDVHALGERALDDAPGARHEPLELGRQQNGLLLIR